MFNIPQYRHNNDTGTFTTAVEALAAPMTLHDTTVVSQSRAELRYTL